MTGTPERSPAQPPSGGGETRMREALLAQLFSEVDDLLPRVEKMIADTAACESAMQAAGKTFDASAQRFIEVTNKYVEAAKGELTRHGIAVSNDAKNSIEEAIKAALPEIRKTLTEAARNVQQERKPEKRRDTLRTIAIAVLSSGATAAAMCVFCKIAA